MLLYEASNIGQVNLHVLASLKSKQTVPFSIIAKTRSNTSTIVFKDDQKLYYSHTYTLCIAALNHYFQSPFFHQ